MWRFVCLAASLVFTGCGVQQLPEAADTVPISATAPIPPGADDPLTALKGKTPQERSPAYRKAPDADRAFAVLDAALERVWSLDDPREMLAEVIRTAAEVDPVRTCDRVRTIAPRLWKLNLPPTQRNVWASFAFSVAAQDPNLRDGLLSLAVIDGRKALAEDKLWESPDKKPKVNLGDDPQQLLNFGRQMLEFNVRLYEAVIEQRADREAAIDLATKLLADAKAKGTCPLGCISRAYGYEVLRNLANLDPEFFLAVIPQDWNKEQIARFCASEAYQRWVNRMRDSITGKLAAAAVENGNRGEQALQILGHYDFARAWDATVRLPNDSNSGDFPRLCPLSYLLVEWAWRDPEAALAAAESEPSESTRRDLIDRVAAVWAYKCPEKIERAVKNQDNAYRRGWACDAAAAELEWRKQGNPPRNTRETIPRLGHSDIAKPAGVPWVPPQDLQKLLDDPTKATEADSRLCELAQHIGQWGPADHASEVLNRVESTYRFVYTSTWVARNLIRRYEYD